MATVTGSIEERRFVVMRFARIKTWSHVYHVFRHNTREMECRHLGQDAPPPRLILGTADVAGAMRKVLERSREQTRFASFFAGMGLERGKERSGARHVSNREHEAMLEQARQEALTERDGLTIERATIAAVGIELGNEPDTLAAERRVLTAQRVRLRKEEQRLADDRAALIVKDKEAEALKRRALARMDKLRELLLDGKRFRACAQSVPLERRTPEMRKAYAAAVQLAAVTESAADCDAWTAQATAFRTGNWTGRSR